MAQRYAALQKKLQEIESKLNELIHHHHHVHRNHSSSTTGGGSTEEEEKRTFDLHCDELIRMETGYNRKYAFLRGVLIAEMESHHHSSDDSDSDGLHHIADRLKACEEEYAKWFLMRTAVTEEEEGHVVDDHDILPCHCTHACFEREDSIEDNDSPTATVTATATAAVDDDDDRGKEEPHTDYPRVDAVLSDGFSDAGILISHEEDEEGEEETDQERKERSVWGNTCIAMLVAVATAIGVAMMDSIGYVEDDVLVPT